MRSNASLANPYCLSFPKSLSSRLKNFTSFTFIARLSNVCASRARLRFCFTARFMPSSSEAKYEVDSPPSVSPSSRTTFSLGASTSSRARLRVAAAAFLRAARF